MYVQVLYCLFWGWPYWGCVDVVSNCIMGFTDLVTVSRGCAGNWSTYDLQTSPIVLFDKTPTQAQGWPLSDCQIVSTGELARRHSSWIRGELNTQIAMSETEFWVSVAQYLLYLNSRRFCFGFSLVSLTHRVCPRLWWNKSKKSANSWSSYWMGQKWKTTPFLFLLRQNLESINR